MIRYFKKIAISIASFFIMILVLNFLSYSLIVLILNSSREYELWSRIGIEPLRASLTWDQFFEYHPFWGYSEQSARISVVEPQFTVRILGGSFAAAMGRHIIENPQRLFEFVKKIKPDVDPQRVSIINNAASGYHQPQQLHAIVDHLADTDLFISYEGYNELMYDQADCSPKEWPVLAQYRFDPQFLKYIPFQYYFYKKSLSLLISWQDISLPKLVLYFVGPYLISQMQKSFEAAKASASKACKDSNYRSSDIQIAVDWVRFLKLTSDTVSSQGKRLFVFVQPNQYVHGSKMHFSEDELYYFRQQNDTEKNLIDSRYHFSRSAINYETSLKKTVFDLTGIFRDVTDTIFIDFCCHINPKGQAIVFEKSMDVIEENWKPL